VTDIARDPFREQGRRPRRWRTRVLGAPFEFSSNSRELLGLARDAFADVPQHRFARATRTLRVSLKHVRGDTPSWKTPPRPRLSSGAGMLCSHVDAQNFVVVDPGSARALVQVDDALMRDPRLVRYEFIELAVVTLALRVQGLVPLHAACVGANGRGLLLVGSSGSGKSTLALHAALQGLDFIAEDSVFVQPASLCASGLSAYVHARGDALPLIADRRVRAAVRASPRIQRRSGVRKHELDLRRGLARLAPAPLRIVGTVVLSARSNGGAAEPLRASELRRVLRTEQAYAASQPGWREFEQRALRAGGYRLGRMPPGDGVSSLRKLLEGTP
jgi:hypothetical protein